MFFPENFGDISKFGDIGYSFCPDKIIFRLYCDSATVAEINSDMLFEIVTRLFADFHSATELLLLFGYGVCQTHCYSAMEFLLLLAPRRRED